MTEWSTRPLGEVADISMGKTPPRADPSSWDSTKSGSNIWVSIADMSAASGGVICDSKEYISDKAASAGRLVPKGTLLMSFKLSIGKLAFAGIDLFTNEAIAALRLDDNSPVTKRYLYHYLSAVDWQSVSAGNEKVKGATLNLTKLAKIPVRFPPKDEQERIVTDLEQATARVVQLTESAVQVARHVGELSRERAEALVVDCGANRISLGDLCEVLDSRRKPITKADRVSGPYPYYGATGAVDFVHGYIFDEPLVLLGEDGAKWAAGDSSAYAVSGKYWVNNHAHVLRPRRERVRDEWLIAYLNAADLGEFITGATVPKLNQGRMREISVPVPPLEDQDAILSALGEVSSRARVLESNYQQIAHLGSQLARSITACAVYGES